MRLTARHTSILMALITAAALSGCGSAPGSQTRSPDDPQAVRPGAEVLLDGHLDELEGQRVGLLMNPTSRVKGTHMLDTLRALGVHVTALFAAEHGFRGEAGAGETIEDGVDQATGLPVHSLYGETRRPTPAMMEEVDVVLADLPDVGARFYTYSATLGYMMEAAAGAGVPVWVLDRPNPAGGRYVAGWVARPEYRSFVGRYPIPMIHGMTLGELARMMAGEGWLDSGGVPAPRVIAMEGWRREMRWPETGQPWIAPSPNLPEFDNAFLYLGTVLFEGTGLSEGRGTEQPFQTIGSPATDLPQEAIDRLNRDFPVQARPAEFTPRSIPGVAASPRHEEEASRGVYVEIEDYGELDPLRFGMALLEVMLEHTEGAELNAYMQNLTGVSNDSLRAWLQGEETGESWREEVDEFRERRKPYLIYE